MPKIVRRKAGAGYSAAFGTLSIARGSLGVNSEKKITLFSWDALTQCEGEICRHADFCPYEKNPMNKCRVMATYIRGAQDVIIENLPKEHATNEPLIYEIGMHLIPLYKTLCRLKMEEVLIHSTDIVQENARGVKYIHPIFKEIRETIKLIQTMWRAIGLKDTFTPGLVKSDPFEEGNYYERMKKEAQKEQLRRVKK